MTYVIESKGHYLGPFGWGVFAQAYRYLLPGDAEAAITALKAEMPVLFEREHKVSQKVVKEDENLPGREIISDYESIA